MAFRRNSSQTLYEGRKMRAFIVLFILLISSSAYTKPVIKTLFSFYDIFPTSKHDLSREIQKRSSVEMDDQIFAAHTLWHVKWEFKWQRKNGLCTITSVKTFLRVIYIMPQIAKDHKASKAIRQSFANYYKSLWAHEKNHMKSGLYAARDIEKELLKLGSYKSYARLDEIANKTVNKIIKKYNKRDEEYDKKTNHGKNEGIDINNFI